MKRAFDQGDVKVEKDILTFNEEKGWDILLEEGPKLNASRCFSGTHLAGRFAKETFTTSDSRVKRVFDQGDVKVEMHIVTLNTEKDEDILVEEGHGVSEGHMPV